MNDSDRSRAAWRAERERSHPHPLRSAIRERLPIDGGYPATLLAQELGETLSVISYHARVLVDAGLAEQAGPGLYRRAA